MDVVLKSGQLTYELEGPVLRVLTRDARTKELQAEAEQKRASQAAPDLADAPHAPELLAGRRREEAARGRAHRLRARHASRSTSAPTCSSSRTCRRTSTTSQQLVAELDRPEPQVEIEAKILQTNRDTARALGVQWGFNGRVAPELGNTTGLGVPEPRHASAAASASRARCTQGPNDPRATELERTGTAINLPVVGATSALGLSMGAINGAFGLDVAITALEHEGKVKILSTPRVTTQNNKQAEVTQGFQIPIQIVAEQHGHGAVQGRGAEAASSRRRSPAANTVIMRIVLENGMPDFSRAVNGNPSINTQRADTQVQVRRRRDDGHRRHPADAARRRPIDKTPGLSNIPLLGWLFKRTDIAQREPGTADLHHAAHHPRIAMSMRQVRFRSWSGARRQVGPVRRPGTGSRSRRWRRCPAAPASRRTGESAAYLLIDDALRGVRRRAGQVRRVVLASDVLTRGGDLRRQRASHACARP